MKARGRPSLVHGGRDAEIADTVSMAAVGLTGMEGHGEEEEAVLEDPAILESRQLWPLMAN